MKLRFAAVAIIVLLASGVVRLAAESGSSDEPTTFSSNVKVVNVPTTVRDKKGKIIGDLKKDDFIVEEDGKPQSIRYFARETDLPLTLGLLVDTSMSQVNVLAEERRASNAFLDNMLREDKDNAFIINFDFDVTLLQDLTSSREKLRTALDDIKPPGFDRPTMRRHGGGGSGDPDDPTQGQHRRRGAGTLFYDSVFLASDEVLKKQEGRKAIIVLTDGDDRGSRETLDQAVEAAQRADTIVYSILFTDPTGPYRGGFGGPMGGGRHGGWGRGGGGYPMPQQGNDGKKVLERISRETGGRMFEVSKKDPIEKIYAQIEEELRNQYSLGYTPVRAADAPSGYHKLHVATKEKDLKVQARAGYYGDK